MDLARALERGQSRGKLLLKNLYGSGPQLALGRVVWYLWLTGLAMCSVILYLGC